MFIQHDRRPPRLLDFNCPLCGSNNCCFVGITRKDGSYFVIQEFFKCAGCSVMFTNPVEFSRLTRDTYTGNWRERKPTREYPPDSDGWRKKDRGNRD